MIWAILYVIGALCTLIILFTVAFFHEDSLDEDLIVPFVLITLIWFAVIPIALLAGAAIGIGFLCAQLGKKLAAKIKTLEIKIK